jgi:hypothetical protein
MRQRAPGRGTAEARFERYLRGGHLRVQGWTPWLAFDLFRAFDNLQRQRGTTGNLAEIGVHHGRSFIALYLLARGDETALALDLFDMQERNQEAPSGKGDLAVFRRNLVRHAGDDRRLRVLRGDTRDLAPAALRDAGGGPFRLFHIDGGHTAAIAEHDFGLAVATRAPGGLIAVDDYFHPVFPGVGDGVRAWLTANRGAGIVPAVVGGGKVWFCAREDAPAYRGAAETLDIGAEGVKHVREMLGEPVVVLQATENPWGGRVWRRVLALRPGEPRPRSVLFDDLRTRGPRRALRRFLNRTVRRGKHGMRHDRRS